MLDRSCRRSVDNVRSGGDEAVVKRLAGGSDEFPDELPHTLTGHEKPQTSCRADGRDERA